jgi:hypothetical protein
LGGLYYFQENDIKISEYDNKLFEKINGVKNNNSGEIYTSFNREAGKVNVFPNTRIINRSVNNKFSSDFKIKSSLDSNGNEKIEDVSISSREFIPSVGYGIYNNFLNEYNKTLFGDYLNGSRVVKESNTPHILSGSYTGVIKPLRTYNSDIEFTAIYRNLNVRDYNFNIDTLKNELDVNIKKIAEFVKGGRNRTADKLLLNNDNIVKCFIIFSKLKAAYLSGQFGNDGLFKTALGKLNSTTNLKDIISLTVPFHFPGKVDAHFMFLGNDPSGEASTNLKRGMVNVVPS